MFLTGLDLKSFTGFSSKKTFYIYLGLISLAAFALVYFPTQKYGVGISPDSIQYIGTARNLVHGNGLLAYDNSRLLLWPPFYPLLLAFLGFLFKCDPLLTIGWLNSILFALIVFSSGILAYRLTKGSVLFALLASIFITFAIPLYGVTLMAWSEPLFILLTVVFFLSLQKFGETRKLSSLLLPVLLAALSSITRYVGITLILTGAAFIFTQTGTSLKRRAIQVFVFGIAASLPLAAWLGRNYLISGTLSGPRMISSFTLLDNFQSFISILFLWFFPKSLYSSRMFIAALFFGLGLLVGLLHQKKAFDKNSRNTSLLPLSLFSFFYIALLFVSSRTGFWGLLDSRYLSPAFIPIVLILITILHKLMVPFKEQYRSWFSSLVIGLLVLGLLANPVITTIKNSRNPIPFREGYNPTDTLASDTMRYLVSHPGILSDCRVFTNSPVELDFFSHIPAETIPTAYPGEFSSLVVMNIDRLKGVWPPDKSCLVWFTNVHYVWMYSITDLEKIASLQVLYSFDDGAIYSIVRK